jgi:polysaccharide transporter, PST family
LCGVAFVMVVLVTLFIPRFSNERPLYLLGFLMVVGQALIPSWFFQGIEQMKYLTYINVAGKLLFTVLIFVLIKKPADYVFVILLYSLGNIVSGIIALVIIFGRMGIPFHMPGVPDVRAALKDGWLVFVSNFAINAYINSNLFILGLFTNNLVTGYYSVADRIVYALRQVLNVFFQATYPQVCKVVLGGRDQLVSFFRAYARPFIILVGVGSTVLFVFAPFILHLLFKSQPPHLVLVLRILAFVPLIVALNIPAFQTLLAHNLQRSYMLILASGSVLSIVLNIALASTFSMTGTAISVLITELFITTGLYLILQKRHQEHALLKSRRPNT